MQPATAQSPVETMPAPVHAYESEEGHHFEWIEFARVALVGIAAAVTWAHAVPQFHGFDFISLAAALIGGYPVFEEAISNLLARRMTMELSMTIALVSALTIREYFTALIILLFVLVAEMLEELTVGRGRRAIQTLLDLMPKQATVRRDGTILDLPIGKVNPGDIVVVKPGAEIPVDGTVVKGYSFVDQSSITGESMRAEKVVGTTVFAGTTNLSGSLEVTTDKLGRDTVFGKIVEAVEHAEQSRAPVQKTADRLSGYLVYFALGAAVITFLITHNTRSTIAVIIVAGACGIAAGTPLAILGAIGRAAHQGAIVKGGLYLETLSQVDTVILDKTGTLTFGDPEVAEIIPVPGESSKDVVEAAAIAERPSEHPLAKAILKRASELGLPVIEPEHFDYSPGKGIFSASALGVIAVGSRALLLEKGVPPIQFTLLPENCGTVMVARNGRLLGAIRTEDRLRPEAIAAVQALKKMNMRVELLTGDALNVANAVAKKLGVDQVSAELLPHQKLERIDTLIRMGSIVVMVGDGVNDAPALAKANVGVAMGSGTDVARQSANVLLLGNNLLDFVETLRIARQCRRVIMTNFIGTLAVDTVGVGLAAFGLLNPLLAAFIHVASEMTFILNSARLVPAFSGKYRRAHVDVQA
ncbi:MAG TPA: cation-translocating P-type ATPase [Bryobacteraceae bacterium]|nr:cation-translocating P-type ATPase [Bryobacteraceae bacterium]HEV8041170.1 cation-translocating P-type ATPase [Bryobacteraceae bacterium]